MSSEKETRRSAWAAILKYGGLGGILLIILDVLRYTTLFTSKNAGGAIIGVVISLIIFVGIVILSIRQHRDKDLGGYISMLTCISTGVATIIVAGLLLGVFDYMYQVYIDPTAFSRTVEASADWFYMSMMGLDEDQVKSFASNQNVKELTLLSYTSLVLISSSVFGLSISSVVGVFMRKDRPEEV